jgi:hypothetical protein
MALLGFACEKVLLFRKRRNPDGLRMRERLEKGAH